MYPIVKRVEYSFTCIRFTFERFYEKKKIFTDLKAYNIADLSSYSYGINKNIAFIMA